MKQRSGPARKPAEGLADIATAHQALQTRALIPGQIKLRRLGTTGHRSDLLAEGHHMVLACQNRKETSNSDH